MWDRLLAMAQARGVELGMVFLDGTSIRAHAKAAEASKKGDLAQAVEVVRRSGARVAALALRPLRDRRCRRTGRRVPCCARVGARAAPRRAPARLLAQRAALGCCRPGLCLPRLPRARLEPRCAPRDPAQTHPRSGPEQDGSSLG